MLTLQAEGATQSSLIVLPQGIGTDLRILQQESVAPGPALHQPRVGHADAEGGPWPAHAEPQARRL